MRRSSNCPDKGRPTGTDQSSEPYDFARRCLEIDWTHASSDAELL
jgi:hypothetical protein